MQPKRSTWKQALRGMAALALLAACVPCGLADPPPDKSDPPKPLPEEIVKAWKQAGAEVGWIRVDKFGFRWFRPEKEGVAGDLPAFRFSDGKQGPLAKLPAPASAFGLNLVDLF